jgi:hypothetical protein
MKSLAKDDSRQAKLVLTIGCCVLLLSLCWLVAGTLHWRLVNDAAQIDYACFLMDHGMSPYKDLVEMNMPGIYLVNWGVMHSLGPGPVAWRCFDFLILGLAGAAMIVISIPYGRLAGLYAAMLFALFHGRDGPAQLGQRDLIVTMLLLWTMAFVFEAVRKNKSSFFFLSWICSSAATTIKPTALPFAILLTIAAFVRLRQLDRPILPALAGSLAGGAIPILFVYLFLMREGSLAAFAYVMREMLPFYARLGRESFGYLLSTSATPSLLTLFGLGLIITLLDRHGWNWERLLIAGGILFGVFAYVGQGKGFPYHRYPLVAFIVLWAATHFSTGMRKSKFIRIVAYSGLLFGVILGPLYALRARHRTWDEAYNVALQADLTQIGASSLSGSVLCLSTAGDCDTTLYRMHLVQDTGLFYDYFIFGNGTSEVVTDSRARILPLLLKSPPKAIILGRGLFPQISDAYEKLDTWPELQRYVETNYTLYRDREFAPAECGQRGYRLYLRNRNHESVASLSQAGAIKTQ